MAERRTLGSSAISSISTIQRSFSTKNNHYSAVSFLSSHQISRNFSSSPPGPSNIVLVESEEQFDSSLLKVQVNHCQLYFTSLLFGVRHEELGKALSKLDINSVPRPHFFQNGKNASEIIGADIQRIQDTMEKLYN